MQLLIGVVYPTVIIDCAMNSCNLMQPAGFDALPESSFSPSLVDKPVLKLRDQKIAQAVGNVFFFFHVYIKQAFRLLKN